MRNIELKARLRDLEAARRIAESLASSPGREEHQIDTYFHCREGRLKLREIVGEGAQLIWYARADAEGPKPSQYQLVPAADGGPLKQALTSALGIRAVVDKRRAIYRYENVRIHLDRVDGLGDFLEFEAVLSAEADEPAAYAKLKRLSDNFGIADNDRICGSYGELVSSRPE